MHTSKAQKLSRATQKHKKTCTLSAHRARPSALAAALWLSFRSFWFRLCTVFATVRVVEVVAVAAGLQVSLQPVDF